MDFNWITPQEAAEEWGITDRRVQVLCANGIIDGVIRLKRGWLIPKNAQKPADGRAKNGRKPVSDKKVAENGLIDMRGKNMKIDNFYESKDEDGDS